MHICAVLIEFSIKAVIIDFQHAYNNQVKLVVEHNRSHTLFSFSAKPNGLICTIHNIYISGSYILDKDHYDVT